MVFIIIIFLPREGRLSPCYCWETEMRTKSTIQCPNHGHLVGFAMHLTHLPETGQWSEGATGDRKVAAGVQVGYCRSSQDH